MFGLPLLLPELSSKTPVLLPRFSREALGEWQSTAVAN